MTMRLGPEYAPELGPLPEHLDLRVPDAELSPTELGRRPLLRRACSG